MEDKTYVVRLEGEDTACVRTKLSPSEYKLLSELASRLSSNKHQPVYAPTMEIEEFKK